MAIMRGQCGSIVDAAGANVNNEWKDEVSNLFACVRLSVDELNFA